MFEDLFSQYFQSSTLASVVSAVSFFVVALIAILVIKNFLFRRLESWSDRLADRVDTVLLPKAVGSVFWFSTLVAIHISFLMLPLPDTVFRYAGHVFTILYATVTISLLINMLSFSLDVFLRRRGSSLMAHRGRVLLPIIKGMAWSIALVFILENFGVEISTILAGMGVAGIAVGFAAQAVLGDLFSYFAILFDRPFRIGDFILLSNDIRGHIEYIGLKTSRLRSLDGEQIILSNTDLTNSRVKNYRRMTRRRALFRFGVLYSTPADKLEMLPGLVKKIIQDTPRATFERAHLQGFGDSSIDFEVVFFVESPEIPDMMDVQQTINLALIRALEEHDMAFAFPTRTLHISPEPEAPDA